MRENKRRLALAVFDYLSLDSGFVGAEGDHSVLLPMRCLALLRGNALWRLGMTHNRWENLTRFTMS